MSTDCSQYRRGTTVFKKGSDVDIYAINTPHKSCLHGIGYSFTKTVQIPYILCPYLVETSLEMKCDVVIAKLNAIQHSILL